MTQRPQLSPIGALVASACLTLAACGGNLTIDLDDPAFSGGNGGSGGLKTDSEKHHFLVRIFSGNFKCIDG